MIVMFYDKHFCNIRYYYVMLNTMSTEYKTIGSTTFDARLFTDIYLGTTVYKLSTQVYCCC